MQQEQQGRGARPPRGRALTLGLSLALSLPLLLGLSGCASPDPGPCDGGRPGLQTLCGFQNPEDIRRLPDARHLLVSEVGSLLAPQARGLALLDTHNGQIRRAYTPATGQDQAEPGWGASDCPGPPGASFSPLGISVQQRLDGRWQVAAVNQAPLPQRVEMFEWLATPQQPGAEAGPPQLAWRGCVSLPAHLSLNSIALRRNGGFVASHMLDPSAPRLLGISLSVWKAELGLDSGHAFEWLPTQEREFRVLEGSHGAFPNGIALSADESEVFLSLTAANQLRKLDRASGRLLATRSVSRPDNLSWDEQGRLLLASLRGSRLAHLGCVRRVGQACGLPFDILRIDPSDLRSERIFSHEGAPMGAATVATPLGDALYLGSFTGDRVLKVAYPKAPLQPAASMAP